MNSSACNHSEAKQSLCWIRLRVLYRIYRKVLQICEGSEWLVMWSSKLNFYSSPNHLSSNARIIDRSNIEAVLVGQLTYQLWYKKSYERWCRSDDGEWWMNFHLITIPLFQRKFKSPKTVLVGQLMKFICGLKVSCKPREEHNCSFIFLILSWSIEIFRISDRYSLKYGLYFACKSKTLR